jgi:hypothetical protein
MSPFMYPRDTALRSCECLQGSIPSTLVSHYTGIAASETQGTQDTSGYIQEGRGRRRGRGRNRGSTQDTTRRRITPDSQPSAPGANQRTSESGSMGVEGVAVHRMSNSLEYLAFRLCARALEYICTYVPQSCGSSRSKKQTPKGASIRIKIIELEV